MDPVTQGVVGAVAPQWVARREQMLAAAALGLLGGMAPDLDVLIRSEQDPLLFLEYHRQFTHSLFFIPVGGLLCAVVLHGLLARHWGLTFGASALFCTLGYATHALLDACTTYGTQLLWPLSDARFAWHTVSVIDPLFTLPALLLLLLCLRRQRRLYAFLALGWCLCYLSAGTLQRERAEAAGWALAEQRGHQALRLEAKPSFGNILLWKLVYTTADFYHVDAVRMGLGAQWYAGDRILRLDLARDFPWLEPGSQQAVDVERFRWFSNGYVARDPLNPQRIIDIRFSMLPNEIDALWGIELRPDAAPDAHVRYRTERNAGDQVLGRFWQMLRGMP